VGGAGGAGAAGALRDLQRAEKRQRVLGARAGELLDAVIGALEAAEALLAEAGGGGRAQRWRPGWLWRRLWRVRRTCWASL